MCVHLESRITLGLLNIFYILNVEQKKEVKIKRLFQGKHFNGRWRTLQQKKSFQPQFGPKKSFLRFQDYYMLDIVASYNLVQYQGELMMQPWKNGKNPNYKPNLEHPPPIFLTGVTSTSSLILFQAIILCIFQEIW